MGVYLIEAGGCIYLNLSFILVIAKKIRSASYRKIFAAISYKYIHDTYAKFHDVETEVRVEVNAFIKQMAIKYLSEI